MTSNLTPGQYQIGDSPGLVFGTSTPFDMVSFDVQPYNTQAQDSQTNRSDTVNFGSDSLQAQPIQIELMARDFQRIKNIEPFTGVTLPEWFDNKGLSLAEQFAFEWNAQAARRTYGQVIPLKCCGRDGSTRVAYGRPRKIHVGKRTKRSPTIPIQAEFMPEDVLFYDDIENVEEIVNQATPKMIHRTKGKADAWYRIVLTGPMTHPIITVGTTNIELDIEIEEGDLVEISSYPWRRRIVDSNGLNLSSKLVGDTQYLDQLTIPSGVDVPIRWTSEELNTWVPTLDDQSWLEKIDAADYYRLPSTFTNIHGKPVVRLDIFNPQWFKFYLAADMFADRSACLYNAKKFGTANQYVEANVVEPMRGKSGMVIMSNEAMTNFAILVVKSGLFSNSLRIYSGSAYNNLTARSAEWSNPAFRWEETDKIGFGFNPTTKMYQAYLNGTSLGSACQWNDSGVIVNTSNTNRSQGFIFDIDGNLLTTGIGFANILAYDRDVEMTDVGQVILAWRDAYNVMS